MVVLEVDAFDDTVFATSSSFNTMRALSPLRGIDVPLTLMRRKEEIDGVERSPFHSNYGFSQHIIIHTSI